MKNNNWIKLLNFVFLVIFMMYGVIFVMVELGYYEYASYKKKVFTNEQIKKFEEDVKNGNVTDISDYLETEEDFQSKPKQIGLKLSEFVSSSSKKTMSGLFNFLNKIMED